MPICLLSWKNWLWTSQMEALLRVPLYTSLAGKEHLLLEAWAHHLRYKNVRVYLGRMQGRTHIIFIKTLWATLYWVTVVCLTCEQKNTCTSDVLGDKRTYLHTFTHPLKEKLPAHAEMSDLCPFNCSCQTKKVVSRIIKERSLCCCLF